MSAYLQRLYDARGTAAAVEARPAQRSSSPLVVVDQRLASATYAASYLLSLTADAEAESGPAPEPDMSTVAKPMRRSTPTMPDETPTRLPSTRPTLAGVPPMNVEEWPGRLPRPDAGVRPPPTPAPAGEPGTVSADAVPTAGTQPPPVAPTRPPRHTLPDPPAVERLPPRDETAIPAPWTPRLEPGVAELPVATEPDVAPPVAEVTPRSAPVRPRAELRASAPPLAHPAPAPAPGRLPPPQAAGAAEPVELAEQVRRLVREAMLREAAGQGQTRERDTLTPADTPASRATTAEARSVIGPLDRPARATTLYGLRLR